MSNYPNLAAMGWFTAFGAVWGIAGYVVGSLFLMKLFQKAGVADAWRAWVPVYNVLIFAKLGDVSPWVMLGALVIQVLPYLNFIAWIALVIVAVMASWRVGVKLQKDWPYLLLWLVPGIGQLIWLGILAFDGSRWNPAVAPAPWAQNSFFADRTVWQGIPVQASGPRTGYPPAPGGYPSAPGAYPPPAGYQAPPPGYQPPPPGYQTPPPGYQPPPPGYQPPPPGYQPPPAGYRPPPPGYQAPPVVPSSTPPAGAQVPPVAPVPPAPSADYRSPTTWGGPAAAAAVPAPEPPAVPGPPSASEPPARPEPPAAVPPVDDTAAEEAATEAVATADAVDDASAEESADHPDDGPVIDFGDPPESPKA